jgi:Type ISP C-terminal specificity domain
LPRRSAPRNDDVFGDKPDELPDEMRVFDYIYRVLHSPDYRRTYAQFLKIDFPRIPYPASPEVFAHVADKGGQLRRLHLMEDAAIGATPYPFIGASADGDDNVVVKPVFVPSPLEGRGRSSKAAGGEGASESAPLADSPALSGAGALPYSPLKGRELGRIHINPDQYFYGVPQVAWEFHIGGYQPVQKWLKDRKGRVLSFDDVLHYQRIIKILCETDRIMQEINLPL